MKNENRLVAVKQAIKASANDDLRYAVGEKLRGLGYIDLDDFLSANPPAEHVVQIEELLDL